MTSGIYIIHNTINEMVYIGKSSNIEDRWIRHKQELSKNTHHSYKLQKDYNYGVVLYYDILEISYEDLSSKEVAYIKEFNSYYCGYNCTTGISTTGSGYDSVNASLNKEDYKSIINYIAYTQHSLVEISKILNVPLSIVNNISSLRRHSWIESEMPVEYAILRNKQNTINPKPRNSNPDIEKVFIELVNTDNSIETILSKYSLSKKQIQHILYGTAYKWLKTIYPKEYSILDTKIKHYK